MGKYSIIKKNKKRFIDKQIHKLNEPNTVEFSSKINNQQGKILVEVLQEVTALQPIVEFDNMSIKSTVSGSVKTIEERQNKDSSYSLSVEVENNFNKIASLKKMIKPNKEQLLLRIKEANLVELLNIAPDKLLCVNLKDTKYTLGLNEVLLKHFENSILKGAQLLKKAFDKNKIFIVVSKNQQQAVQKTIEKLNLKVLEIVKNVPKDAICLEAQTALDLYEAVNAGIVRTQKVVALAGESLLKPNYYVVKLGTTIRELIELCGGTKHTYQEVEAFKEDAQMAVFDQIQIKKEIKEEKDKQKKQELLKLLKNKKEEAQKTIFDHFKLNQKKYSLCLSDMVFLEGENWYSAKSLSNTVEHTTNAVLFLSNKEQKNKYKQTKH